MNTFFWIFISLSIIDIGLFIFSFIKNKTVIEKTTKSLLIPFLSGIGISFLFAFLPDSYHIIKIAAEALFTASLCQLCFLSNRKIISFLKVLLYLAVIFFWALLLLAVVKIYSISKLFLYLSNFIYFALFVSFCIYIGRKPFKHYIGIFIGFVPAALLNLTAIISIIKEQRLFSYVYFIGTILLLCEYLFCVLQKTKPFSITDKKGSLINTIFFTSSQIFIFLGAILMLF